jgi:hypothetical protein
MGNREKKQKRVDPVRRFQMRNAAENQERGGRERKEKERRKEGVRRQREAK